MKHILTVLIFLTAITHDAVAQEIGKWKAYTSMRTINDLTVDNENNIWAATNGGVLKISEEEDFSVYTTIEGMSRLDGRAVAFDNENNQLFVGYVNGVIDVINLDTEEVQRLDDIERSTSFTAKGINDLLIDDRFLYAATDFGIVVFNMDELYVQDSFIQMGSFQRAIPVLDLTIANDTLYAGAQTGMGIGDLSTELSLNTNWATYDSSNGFINRQITAVSYFKGSIFASTADSNYVFDGNTWQQNLSFGNNTIADYSRNEMGTLVAMSNSALYISDDGTNFQSINLEGNTAQAVRVEPDRVYVGSFNSGVGIIELSNMELNFITPPGPYQNYFDDISFDGNILFAPSTQRSARFDPIDNGKGYYIFDGSEWKNFNRQTNDVINSFAFRQAFTATKTQDYYYFGSWGRGVARHTKATDEILIFDETNSALRGWPDNNPLFPVISGLETDSNDDVWLVSRFGETPLYFQHPGDDDWISFPKASAAANTDEYFGLFIDSFGQKWISLQSNTASGNGILVLNTGSDPEDPSDDTSEKLTSNTDDGNLPDEQVKAIVQDKNGEIWIGTSRGIARFIFPELIIDGGPNEKRAQWLINEDTTAVSRFLLRDVNVSAMAVNAANEKWIGSPNQGIWVLNAEGSRIIKRFTTENSPLFSNSIESIGIDDRSGEVFIATELGLISYQDIPKQPVSDMGKLKVFPNPFAYSKHSQIVIEGLSDATRIKILGIDGVVVQELSARGGRTSWDGLDYNGNQIGTGVYFVVAYEDSGREKGIGKVVIVR